MNSIIILCTIISLGATADIPIPDEAQAVIINYQNTNDGAGNYQFNYETSNGLFRAENGHLVNVGKEDEYMAIEGSYSYTDVDGKVVFVSYTADKNGYRINKSPPGTVYRFSAPLVATLLGK